MLIQQGQTASLTVVCDIVFSLSSSPNYATPTKFSIAKGGAVLGTPGGSFVAAVHLGAGPWYARITLTAADTNTLGQLTIVIQETGSAMIGKMECNIVAFNPNDSASLGLTGVVCASVTGNVGGNLVGNVNGNVVGSVGSLTGPVASVTGNVGGNLVGSVGSVAGNVVGSVGSVVAPTDVSVAGLAAIVAALLDTANTLDVGQTLRQSLRLLLAALAGQVAISGTNVTILDTTATKNRIVATTDDMGQRSALTYDVS